MIHAMGAHRLRKKNNPSYVSFSFQLNSKAPILIYIFLFYALNSLGTLVANILKIGSSKGFEDAATAILLNKIDIQSYTENMKPAPISFQQFMHDNGWSFFTDRIVKLLIQLFRRMFPLVISLNECLLKIW